METEEKIFRTSRPQWGGGNENGGKKKMGSTPSATPPMEEEKKIWDPIPHGPIFPKGGNKKKKITGPPYPMKPFWNFCNPKRKTVPGGSDKKKKDSKKIRIFIMLPNKKTLLF